MEITESLMIYLEELSRLNLTEDEKQRTQKDLNSILKYMDKLNELDTSDVEPSSHAIPMVNVFREDIVTNKDDRERILTNAPDRSNGAFRVPRILE